MKIFIAAPFTGQIDSSRGLVKSETKDMLTKIQNFFREKGYDTFLAHKRENWGLNLMEPQECTTADYREMENSDIVLAIPGHPPSGGVHIEIGWASAMKKKNDYSYRKK